MGDAFLLPAEFPGAKIAVRVKANFSAEIFVVTNAKTFRYDDYWTHWVFGPQGKNPPFFTKTDNLVRKS